MIAHPHTDASRQNTGEVRAFFEQWAIYRKVVDLDCLNHRGAYAVVEAVA